MVKLVNDAQCITINQERPNSMANQKDLGGRPTKLDNETQVLAEMYSAGSWGDSGDVVPSVEGMALYLKVSRSTVKLWASQDDRFSATVEEVKSIQARKLINMGLSGEFNSSITKLLLNNHGYTEKTETQSTVTFEQLSDEELNAKIQAFTS